MRPESALRSSPAHRRRERTLGVSPEVVPRADVRRLTALSAYSPSTRRPPSTRSATVSLARLQQPHIPRCVRRPGRAPRQPSSPPTRTPPSIPGVRRPPANAWTETEEALLRSGPRRSRSRNGPGEPRKPSNQDVRSSSFRTLQKRGQRERLVLLERARGCPSTTGCSRSWSSRSMRLTRHPSVRSACSRSGRTAIKRPASALLRRVAEPRHCGRSHSACATSLRLGSGRARTFFELRCSSVTELLSRGRLHEALATSFTARCLAARSGQGPLHRRACRRGRLRRYRQRARRGGRLHGGELAATNARSPPWGPGREAYS